jgi:uncharacterized membrane protein YuzA (DUF378 family)
MKTRDQSRLASTISLLVGIWVLLSPIWISVTGGALTSIIITGIVIIAASVVQYFTVNTIPSWVVGVASLWLLLSAVVFGVSAAAGWSQILAAIVGLLSAYWDGFEMTSMNTNQRHHHGPSAV